MLLQSVLLPELKHPTEKTNPDQMLRRHLLTPDMKLKAER